MKKWIDEAIKNGKPISWGGVIVYPEEYLGDGNYRGYTEEEDDVIFHESEAIKIS